MFQQWRWALALPVAAVVLLGACGDDDDSGDSRSVGNSGGGTGSDEKYVADICSAFKKMSDSLTKVTSDPSKFSDPKQVITQFSKPFEQLAKDFANANPPKDLKEWHKEASKTLNQGSAAIKKGDFEALQSLGELPDPPKGADERLSKIADKNKDCQDGNFDFKN